MQTLQSFRSLLLVVAVLGTVAISSEAQASPVFPGALQEAANMECVPLCTMCHAANPGTATTWVAKELGRSLKGIVNPNNPMETLLKAGDEESLKAAFKVYASTALPATLAEIQKGIEPGTKEDVCGPTYGCAIPMIAKQPARPRDYTAALWVVSAMVVGGILRRRRKINAG